MNQYKYSSGKRAIAAGAAILTAAAGVLISSSLAYADPVAGPVTEEIGSITIHKHLNPGFDSDKQNPDGTEGTGGSPLDGVTFEVCPINGIDLIGGGNAAWEEIRGLGPLAPAVTDTETMIGTYTLGTCAEETTATVGTEEGLAVFTNLDVGAYLVREIDAPATVVERSDPFIVTVPTPATADANLGEWLYDVHIYPKNQALDVPTKEIVNQGAGTAMLGDEIDYRITQVLPGVEGGDYKTVIMTDTLDDKLTPVKAKTVTVSVKKTNATVNDLTIDTDFTAVWDAQELTVTLLPVTLGALLEGDTITIDFTAIANENGVIENTAFVNVNDFEVESDPVETRWGAVDLTKVNGTSTADPLPGLEGAEFSLYMGSTNVAGCSATGTGPTSGNTLVASDIVSGANGVLGTGSGTTFAALPGLWIDDSSTGAGFDTRCYFLVETLAPAGFVLPATDELRTTEFIVHPGETANPEATVKIENEQQTVPELPLTGGVMQTVLLLTGGGLLATALGLLVVRRRKAIDQPVL